MSLAAGDWARHRKRRMRKKNQPSRVYLLRCWQEGETTSGQDPHWRFLVEEVLQDERRRKGFNSLSALFAFLQAELSGDGGKAGGMPE